MLKRSWGGEVKNVSVLVAIGVDRMVTARFWACAKARRRTRPAGWGSSGGSRAEALRASAWWSRTSVWDWWMRWARCTRRPTGSVAWCTGTATSSGCPAREAARGGDDAEGDPRPGGPRGGRGKALEVVAKLGSMKLRTAAGWSRNISARRWGTRISVGALDQDQDQQPDGALAEGDASATKVVGAFPDGKRL